MTRGVQLSFCHHLAYFYRQCMSTSFKRNSSGNFGTNRRIYRVNTSSKRQAQVDYAYAIIQCHLPAARGKYVFYSSHNFSFYSPRRDRRCFCQRVVTRIFGDFDFLTHFNGYGDYNMLSKGFPNNFSIFRENMNFYSETKSLKCFS
jgi:hypothetical protein